MMTDTVVAVEPQEEHAKATPSAFVKDSQPPALAAAESVVLSSAETQLVRSLVRRTRAAGGDLTGPDGLLKHLTKTVIESALEEELVDHLGYDKHDPVGRNGGNSRNGYRSKTVVTDTSGEVTIDVPRDRDGSFEPRIVAKRQRRLSDLDTLVISLYSKGLTTGEISAHLLEVYGANVSKDTVSRITDKIVDDMTSWSARPLEAWRFPVIVANPDWKGFRADDSNSSDHRCGTLTECDFSRVPDATSAQRSPGPDPSPRVGSA